VGRGGSGRRGRAAGAARAACGLATLALAFLGVATPAFARAGASRAPHARRAAARHAAAPRYPHALALALRRRAESERGRDRLADARWGGSLDDIRRALRASDRADSAYAAALDALGEGGPMRRGLPGRIEGSHADSLGGLALDLVARRRYAAAEVLLGGPLHRDRRLLPLRAWARGRAEGAEAGLKLLDWPPERRAGAHLVRGVRGDAPTSLDPQDLALWVAASLSDSAGDGRAARAALWTLVRQGGSPAVREAARLSLARRLFAEGEPALAASVLTREPGRSLEETTLLARILKSGGDTLSAIGWLLQAVQSSRSAAERYAAAMPAAEAALKGRVDSLTADQFTLLATTLGSLGEADLALKLLDRRGPPPAAEADDRQELRASLLLRARRYDDAAKLYRTLLARSDAPARDRAADALSLARAFRGAHSFQPMDSAFVLAASLAPGPTRDAAAWERAREWEDTKPAADAAPVFHWALDRIDSDALSGVARVHAALCWERSGRADSARTLLEMPRAGEGVAWFWRGRLALDAGDSTEARTSFTRAAKADPLSYEGVRAREELGLPPLLSAPRGPARETRVADRSAADPPLEARVADLVGLPGAAEESLREAATGSNAAASNGATDALEARGVYRVGRKTAETELRLMRPPAYPRAVLDAADSEHVDPYLLWALMLQESGFDHGARSRAGAIGLLQLLPKTASRLAGHSVTADDLTDPEENVRLAARYFAGLLREFGEPRAAIAAYNAGEDAVRRWRSGRPAIDDLWVELIPYHETREYVKSVYTTWRQYAAIYGTR
jgi:soluble lytic murein transglycosylase-like protein